jgi:hypothetical protein
MPVMIEKHNKKHSDRSVSNLTQSKVIDFK